MRSRRSVISHSLVSSSNRVSIGNNVIHFCFIPCLSFLQSLNLNPLILIFQNLQFLLPIEQVHYFAAINFEEGHQEVNTPLCRGGTGVHIFNCELSRIRHRVSLP